jgi:hypothetical protein
MTEWIFAFNSEGGVIPDFIRFVTKKTKDEIKNYSDNTYYDNTGMGLLSIWYCDEYTEDHDGLGHKIVNKGGTYGVYEMNDEILERFNLESIPVVDLDVVFSKPKIKDTGYYGELIWQS